MKNASVILLSLAVLTLAGGVLAFKASKFNGLRAFTMSDKYTTLGTIYVCPMSVCLPIVPSRFITDFGTVLTTVYSSTGSTSTLPVICTRQGGTQTIAFPAWACSVLPNTFTTALN